MSDALRLDEEVYAELRRLARRVHAGHGDFELIQPTELLHEAWLKLANGRVEYRERSHFIAVAARAMRHILVDRARRRLAQKRGGHRLRTTVSGLSQTEHHHDILAIDTGLEKLEAVDPLAADVFVARALGGLTLEDTGTALDISRSTAVRKWRFARVFMIDELGESSREPGLE